ncbi:hypothetical protein ABEB36_014148 [Hypothenemus hampei]|uniref:Uncharacterized protein n=1 Tax=Hypothenemus hampei TaxID=57062 RepID=A0ABD1E3R6_HYPHA
MLTYCHDKDTSPLRTSTHNLKPPSPVLTRVTTIVRVNQNKRPTDQNKKSGDPNPSKQSWGTIPNSEYSFDRGENPSPRRESNRRRCYVILITRPAVVYRSFHPYGMYSSGRPIHQETYPKDDQPNAAEHANETINFLSVWHIIIAQCL